MKSPAKIFWLISSLFFVSGCTGNQISCTSLAELSGDCNIEPGDEVRINLKNCTTAEGIIETVSSSEIVLVDLLGESNPRIFADQDILSVEKKTTGPARTITGVLVIGALLVILGIGIANMDLGL